MDSQRLRRIARRQSGLFTRAQAIACGFSRGQIQRRVRAGVWKRIIGRVMAESGLDITARHNDRAAQLAVPQSVLAGLSAARAWGIAVPDSRPHLLVARRIEAAPPGVHVTREALDDREVCICDGGLVTSRPRTIVDCLRHLPERAALDLLDRALQRQWIHPDELIRYAQTFAGRRGAPKLARLISRVASGSRSAGERRLVGLLRGAAIVAWRGNVEIYDGRGLIGVVDAAFDEAKVVIEVDGWAFHVTPDRFQRDRERQNRLVAGWTVLRFAWRDLVDRPAYVVRTIREVTG
jgi:hypothetical protein